MKVDSYKVMYPAIADVIDKLCEADGSPYYDSMLQYLAEASSKLIFAVSELEQQKHQTA